jgi:hypothetical protein
MCHHVVLYIDVNVLEIPAASSILTFYLKIEAADSSEMSAPINQAVLEDHDLHIQISHFH